MYTALLTLVPLAASAATLNLPFEEQGDRAAAEAPPALELEPLRSPAGPRSSNPTLTHGADGRIYLAWFEAKGHRGGAVRFSVLGENGWSKSLEIVKGGELQRSWADSPAVSALEDGTLMATWLRSGDSPHGFMTEFSISSDRGRTWAPPRPLHTDLSAAEHGFASIVPLGAGLDDLGFGAIWLDGRDATAMRLYFRTISAAGELGHETVLDPRVCDCCQTSLSVTPGGSLLALYRDRSSREIRDISFVRLAGETWSEPRAVHADEWLIAGCPVNGPRGASGTSSTAAAWFTGVGDGGGSVLVAFKKAGAARFGFPIDVDDGQPVGRADVVACGEGSAIVSWLEYAGEGGAEWRLRQVWEDGLKGNFITVEQVPFDRNSGYLRMVANGETTVVAWTMAGPERRVGTARIRIKK